MANAVVTKAGDILDVVWNTVNKSRYSNYATNVNSGKYVAVKKASPTKLETNLLCEEAVEILFSNVDTVAGATLSGADDEAKALDLFNKLKALL